MNQWQSAEGLLALMGLPGVGPARAIAAGRGQLDVEALADSDALPNLLDRATRQLEEYEAAEVSTLGFFDDGFPESLREIPQAPAVLYVRGTTTWPTPALAVVGTREPTIAGEKATRELTRLAASRGIAIVSGLALGVDTVAHETALAEGARTIAVLGCGLDAVSPRQNRGLAERILAAGGSLVSEQPFGVEPGPQTLVPRNRLQSGLSSALLVGQTGVGGGTLHTVRFAAEQGRPIYCPVLSDQSEESAGLKILLNTPGRALPNLLPAWSGHVRLAERFGGAPVASGVTAGAQIDWLGNLENPVARSKSLSNDGQLPLDI